MKRNTIFLQVAVESIFFNKHSDIFLRFLDKNYHSQIRVFRPMSKMSKQIVKVSVFLPQTLSKNKIITYFIEIRILLLVALQSRDFKV